MSSNKTDKSREYKDQMNFDNAVVLPAINEVRKTLASGNIPKTELSSLISVLPEPVRKDVMGEWDKFRPENHENYSELVKKNNEIVEDVTNGVPSWDRDDDRKPELNQVRRQLFKIEFWCAKNRLLLVIDSLDRHGLLRRQKVVQEGSA